MDIATFPEQTAVFAKDQPQYRQLPAHVSKDGKVTCCWNLTWRERVMVLFTGKVWHQVLTFHSPLQPQKLSAEKPDLEA